jgi:peptidyl-prolyl cis-trans isomerase B (cyclophilin B)
MITMTTNLGPILLELDEENAPKTCENFLQYIKDGFFDGTIFHRVIDNFMIQGGGFLPGMIQKETREPIENEAKNKLCNEIGSIAMARTMEPHSATAQFFINVANNKFLDHPGQDGWGYCVFGKVVGGMEVVNKIKGVATSSRSGHQDVPVDDIIIEKVEITD